MVRYRSARRRRSLPCSTGIACACVSRAATRSDHAVSSSRFSMLLPRFSAQKLLGAALYSSSEKARRGQVEDQRAMKLSDSSSIWPMSFGRVAGSVIVVAGIRGLWRSRGI